MIRCRTLPLIRTVLLVAILALPGFAHDLIVCDFTGTSPSTNTPWTKTSLLAPGLTFSGWDLGAGAYPTTGENDAFAFHVNAPSTGSTLPEAVAEGEYLGFTIDQSGSPLDLSGMKIAFTIERMSWHAPRRFALFSSVREFNPDEWLFVTPTVAQGSFDPVHFTFVIPLTGYGGITGPVEFRLYAFEAAYNHPAKLTAFSIVDPGPVYSLDLKSGSGGTVSSDPPGTLFPPGTVISLEAHPGNGFRFDGWNGDVQGLGNPRVITLDGNMTVRGGFEPPPPPGMELGTNLGGIVDWATSWDFVDVFRMSRVWLTRSVGGTEWESHQESEIPADSDGWPTRIPFTGNDGKQHFVHTIVPLPEAGDYTLIVTGSGRIRFRSPGGDRDFFPAGGVASTYTITVPPSGSTTGYLEIRESSQADPIRNVRLVRPGFAGSHRTDPFHPLFIERLEPFNNLRFMDWAKTNGSPLAAWSDRTTTSTCTQTRPEGTALEFMVDLANGTGRDLWICIPHEADDDYVRRCARLLRDTVDLGLKIYVEYSNETWNTIFSQTTYVQDRGEALGLSSNRWEAGQLFCSLRSVQIFEIFAEEFVDDSRFVKVMATQSAGISITETRFAGLNDPAINPNYIMPDALATAPYFGEIFTPDDIPPAVPSYPTVDDILDVMAPDLIARTVNATIDQKKIADRQGARLICYEGGQHFVGSLGAENDQTLTAILHQANGDPRMFALYGDYLDRLCGAGVDLFGNFSYVSEWSKWGSWGVLRYQDQPLSEAHKYRALAGYGTLVADVPNLSASTGGTISFSLQAGFRGADRPYLLFGSMSGILPGTVLPGGAATVPLNSDLFTDFILKQLNGPLFAGFRGKLDAAGAGSARLDTLGPLHTGFTGKKLDFAFALQAPWDFASNPVRIEIVP